MSESEYLKCPCKECGNNIEYPLEAARTTITCPHCGEWTELPAPDGESDDEPVTRSLAGLAILVLLPLAALAGGAYVLWHHSSHAVEPVKTPAATAPVPKTPAKTPDAPVSPPVASNPPVALESSNPPAPAEKRPKSPSDLVVGPITLDKTKGTHLVHAVGTVKNNSNYERFRVKVTVDLINKMGVKIGTAEDQKSVMEPNEIWKFHALVADPKTVGSASLASLTEEQ